MSRLAFRQSLRPAAALRPTLLAVVLANLAAQAHAQTAEPVLPTVTVQDQAPERADGPVTGYRATRSATFTKTDTPLKDVPASVSVVPETLIKDQAMRGMGDVLRYVPGTTMGQGEGNRDQPVLRGINTTADFFVDGVRDDAQYFRDLYNVERVEVLKGPGGMAFGRGGAGGVVNRVTKRADFRKHGALDFTLGSHAQRRAAADVGGKFSDAAAWRINGMIERADSYRNGVELAREAINPTMSLVAGEKTAVTLGLEHLRDRRTADRGVPSQNGRPFDGDPSTFFGNAEQSVSRATVDGFAAVVDHDFGDGLSLRNSFRVTRYDKFYQNVFAGSAVNGAGNLTLSAYNSTSERTNTFNQTDLVSKATLGGMEHTLLAGVELGHQDSTSQRLTGRFGAATSITVPASAPFASATSFFAAASDANNAVKADVAALYVQDQVALTPQWKVLAGVRVDRFEVDFDDRRATGTDLSRSDTETSPRLGVVWQPSRGQTYYASYSTAFLPSGEQLSLATNTADLAPEQANNYELGARWDLTPQLALSAAVFRLDRDDVKVADPVTPGRIVQTGQQRTEGVELGLQGELMRGWQIYAGAAVLDGRITQPIGNGGSLAAVPAGRKIGLVPERSASLWNKVELGSGLAAGLGVIHQSSSHTSFTNTVTLPAFTRVDGALYYTLAGGKTRLAMNVENLFDREYFPTAHSDNNISPGAPRNVQLTLHQSF